MTVRPPERGNDVLLFSACIIIFFIGLLCCVPPVSRDALTHHLAIPAQYLDQGGIYEIPYLRFSYYPMTLDLLYMIPLYFGNDILPKFIHFSFALMTAFLIFRYLERRLSRFFALLGVILFLTIPVIMKLSTTAYVDLGLIFFTTASILYLLKWIETDFSAKYLISSSVLCGLGLGVKYNGLITLFLLTLFVPYLYSTRASSKSRYKGIVHGGVYLLIALVMFSPWAVKNFTWTGNPLYPLFDSVFDQETMTVQGDGERIPSHFVIRHFNYDESFLEIIMVPIRIFFQGQDGSPKYFDGKLNPLLLLLPIFAFWGSAGASAHQTEKKVLLMFSVLYILFVFFRRDMRIRYVSPVIPALVILAMYGLNNLILSLESIDRRRCRQGVKTLFVGIILAFFSLNLAYAYSLFKYIDPIDFLSGRVDRHQYIERYVSEYPVLRYANDHLPETSTILSLFLGNRSYYSRRNTIFDENMLLGGLIHGTSSEQLTKSILNKGISHVLIRYDLFLKWVNDNLDGKQQRMFNDMLQHHMELQYFRNGYGLFVLKSA